MQQPPSLLLQQPKGSTLTHIVRPDLDRLDQMIGKLQRCTTGSTTTTTCVSPNDNNNSTMNGHHLQARFLSTQPSMSSKARAAPPPPSHPPIVVNGLFKAPPPPPPPTLTSTSSLPATFVSSLRQLFSILDKTNSGRVPFDVFKRYWAPSLPTNLTDSSSPPYDLLHELELESKSHNYSITFELLLSVIERSLSSSKHSSPTTATSDSSLSSIAAPPIIVPKATRPPPPISFPLNRSTSVVVVTPTPKKFEQQIPITYRSYNGSETTYHHHTQEAPVRHRRKLVSQKTQTTNHHHHFQNGNLYSDAPRRNTIHTHEIDFAMIRALKRFEIERDLLLQTCDTLDRVKAYLVERLLEMKDKQRGYCLHLSTAETTGTAPEPIYNRDLVADLLKLASTVLVEANYDSKKSSDRSSSSLSSSSFNGGSTNMINGHQQQQLKAKNDRIHQLETEKRVLLKELVELRHQQRTVIATKGS